MTTTEPTPPTAGSRPVLARFQARAGNDNHHLWNNHGTWFLHYTRYPTPVTKERVRVSLRTRCVEEARRRRDAFLSQATRATAA